MMVASGMPHQAVGGHTSHTSPLLLRRDLSPEHEPPQLRRKHSNDILKGRRVPSSSHQKTVHRSKTASIPTWRDRHHSSSSPRGEVGIQDQYLQFEKEARGNGYWGPDDETTPAQSVKQPLPRCVDLLATVKQLNLKIHNLKQEVQVAQEEAVNSADVRARLSATTAALAAAQVAAVTTEESAVRGGLLLASREVRNTLCLTMLLTLPCSAAAAAAAPQQPSPTPPRRGRLSSSSSSRLGAPSEQLKLENLTLSARLAEAETRLSELEVRSLLEAGAPPSTAAAEPTAEAAAVAGKEGDAAPASFTVIEAAQVTPPVAAEQLPPRPVRPVPDAASATLQCPSVGPSAEAGGGASNPAERSHTMPVMQRPTPYVTGSAPGAALESTTSLVDAPYMKKLPFAIQIASNCTEVGVCVVSLSGYELWKGSGKHDGFRLHREAGTGRWVLSRYGKALLRTVHAKEQDLVDIAPTEWEATQQPGSSTTTDILVHLALPGGAPLKPRLPLEVEVEGQSRPPLLLGRTQSHTHNKKRSDSPCAAPPSRKEKPFPQARQTDVRPRTAPRGEALRRPTPSSGSQVWLRRRARHTRVKTQGSRTAKTLKVVPVKKVRRSTTLSK